MRMPKLCTIPIATLLPLCLAFSGGALHLESNVSATLEHLDHICPFVQLVVFFMTGLVMVVVGKHFTFLLIVV